MKTITREITLYRFEELPEAAKEKLRQEEWERGYDWSGEAIKTLEAAAKHFGGRLVDYGIDWGNSVPHAGVTWDMPELEREEITERLLAVDTGEGKLTGYYLDESFLHGFRSSFMSAELAGGVDLERHMDAGYEALFADAVADYEYQCSDAALAERYADDWFTEDGEVDPCA